MVDLVRAKREQILRLARKHGVIGVRCFGSMARGNAGPHSDVDRLVEAGLDPSPWFPGGLVAELEELLGGRDQKAPGLGRSDRHRSELARPLGDIRKSSQDGFVEGQQRATDSSGELNEQRIVDGHTGRDGAEQRSLAQRTGRNRFDTDSPGQPKARRSLLG